MAIAAIFEQKGMTAEQYDKVINELEKDFGLVANRTGDQIPPSAAKALAREVAPPRLKLEHLDSKASAGVTDPELSAL